jgi:YHS domain-containing protein
MRRSLRTAGFALALALPLGARALEPVEQSWRGIAIEGTDPVAYFTDGKPVAGSKEFELEWNGATWRFASAAHRDQFRADPERFAPQYGGYCAWAVGHGHTAKTDPDAWAIVGGKLYLNYDREVQKQWLPEKERWIEAADENWPRLRDAD